MKTMAKKKPAKLGPVKRRSATPPVATPPPAEPPAQQRNAGANLPPAAAKTYRTSAEASAERSALIREAEALETKSRSGTISTEEDQRLSDCIDEAERLTSVVTQLQRSERLTAARTAQATPTRGPLPPGSDRVPAQARAIQASFADSMRSWMMSIYEPGNCTEEDRQRSAAGGMTYGSESVKIECDYGTLNAKKRAMSKGVANLGGSTVPQPDFSAKIVEFITYFSPFLTLLDSETTANAVDRDYNRIDDTAMMSSYILAGGGTELAPNIPDTDPQTSVVRIPARDITSGYHKLTRQVLRDSSLALMDKVLGAIGNSHARRIERDCVVGAGVTEARGVLTAAGQHGVAVNTITPDVVEGMYFGMPLQYRRGAIWLCSDSVMAQIKKTHKDTTGRTLLSKVVDSTDNAEIETLHGRPIYISEHMPAYANNAKGLLLFHPMFYMLRLVSGQTIDTLKERFHPLIAFCGMMAFGGDWIGPASACRFLLLGTNVTP